MPPTIVNIENLKEEVSKALVKLLAVNGELKTLIPDPDFGNDISFRRIHSVNNNHYNKSAILDVQVKSAFEKSKSVTFLSGEIKYDLKVKTYNDLVMRVNERYSIATPFIFILCVLPDDPKDWIDHTVDTIITKAKLYWYRPAKGASTSTNTNTVRISIPLSQSLHIKSISSLYEDLTTPVIPPPTTKP